MFHLSNINEIPTTKSGIEKAVESILQPYQNEEKAAIQDAVALRSLVEIAEGVLSKLKPILKEEIQAYGKKTSVNSVELSITQGAAKYSFHHDLVWEDLENQIANLKILQKNREKLMIQAANSKNEIADEYGCIVPKAVFVGYQSDKINFSFPK
jgi:hypothetical protein